MRNKLWKLLFCLLVLFQPAMAIGQSYITWQGLEPDKLASLWLIKRFVDPQAEFVFVAKGSKISNGIPFDVPSAQYKRSHTQSTFECILQDQKLDNRQLRYIGQVIHDIEINTWDIKKIEQTHSIQSALQEIIDGEHDEQKGILKAIQFFDQLYKKI